MILADGGESAFFQLIQDSSWVVFPAGFDQLCSRGHSGFVPLSPELQWDGALSVQPRVLATSWGTF